MRRRGRPLPLVPVQRLPSSGNHRLAILLTGVFFFISLGILAFVNERRGRAQVEPAK